MDPLQNPPFPPFLVRVWVAGLHSYPAFRSRVKSGLTQVGPVVLLVIAVDSEVLFQRLVSTFGLSITLKVVTRGDVGDPSKIRPYSSLTGLLISLFSLTAFSFRKPKNKRKAE